MKQIKLVLSIFVILILSFNMDACNSNGKTESEATAELVQTPVPMVDEVGRVTPEYVLQNSDLLPDDIRKVVLDDVISFYDITPEKYTEKPFKEWIEDYKETKYYSWKNEYEYLAKNPAVNEKYTGNGDDIYVVALYEHPNTTPYWWLYNFETNEIKVYDYRLHPEKLIGENEKQSIRNLVASNVPTWEKQYKGISNSDDVCGWFSWKFIIETKDGKIYRYEGEGQEIVAPTGYDEFAEEFKSFIPEKQ